MNEERFERRGHNQTDISKTGPFGGKKARKFRDYADHRGKQMGREQDRQKK